MGKIQRARTEDLAASSARSQVLRVCGFRLGFLSESFIWKAVVSHSTSP